MPTTKKNDKKEKNNCLGKTHNYHTLIKVHPKNQPLRIKIILSKSFIPSEKYNYSNPKLTNPNLKKEAWCGSNNAKKTYIT